MKMSSFVRLVAPFSFALALAAVAHAKLSAAGAGSVEFTATGPGGLKIVGKSSDVQVADDATHVKITVPLAKLDTGISLRNSHMRDKYLETDKYPDAVLTVAKTAIKYPNAGSGDAPGTLKLHGQEKPVTVHYEVAKQGAQFVVSGTTKVQLGDYGIEQPSFAGAKVKPEVNIAVSFRANDQ